MAIYVVHDRKALSPVKPIPFADGGWKERDDLQRLLRDEPGLIDNSLLIVSEEYGNWAGSSRKIDLLAVNRDGQLVVIELKRTDDGGHMELQAIRYAAMVANMTFEQLVDAYAAYLDKRQHPGDARTLLIEHLQCDPEKPEISSARPGIVLVSAGFSTEITTSVLWLNQIGLDIRCVRVQLFQVGGQEFLDVDQVLPLPEAQDYIVQLKKKAAESAAPAFPDIPWTSEEIVSFRHAIQNNPTLVALLDLCAERPGSWVGLSEATSLGGQTAPQARGAMGGLTTLVRGRFKRGNWPIEFQWNAGGGGQSYYRVTPEIAEWWKQSAPPSLADEVE